MSTEPNNVEDPAPKTGRQMKADATRQQMQRALSVLKSDVEDLERRLNEGHSGTLVAVAARALDGKASELRELGGRLAGEEEGDET